MLKKLVTLLATISIFIANITIFNNINVLADDGVKIFSLDDPQCRDLCYALHYDDLELLQQIMATQGIGTAIIFDIADLRHLGLPVRRGQQQEYFTLASLAILFHADACLNWCLNQGGDHIHYYQYPGQMSTAECAASIGRKDLMVELHRRYNFPEYKRFLFVAIDGMDATNPHAADCTEIVRWLIRDKKYPLYILRIPDVEEFACRIANLRWRDFRGLTHIFDQGRADTRFRDNLGYFIRALIQHGAPTQTILFFLNEFPELLTWEDLEVRTMLHIAAEARNPEVVEYLVNVIGMDVNAHTFDKRTPLQFTRFNKSDYKKNPFERSEVKKIERVIRAAGGRRNPEKKIAKKSKLW
ncbi:MAG: hypothetical protein LBJ95_00970 [Oscillospiraceae bacterium]|nr:hypothetical protein [Oscillospiraceae bacterium]